MYTKINRDDIIGIENYQLCYIEQLQGEWTYSTGIAYFIENTKQAWNSNWHKIYNKNNIEKPKDYIISKLAKEEINLISYKYQLNLGIDNEVLYPDDWGQNLLFTTFIINSGVIPWMYIHNCKRFNPEGTIIRVNETLENFIKKIKQYEE